MAKATNQFTLKEFALIGARMRIQELKAEIDRIKKQFGRHTLGASARAPGESGVRPGPVARVADGSSVVGNGRKRTMSAAGRKRISDAQKARWAKRRSEAAAAELVAAEVIPPATKAKRTSTIESRRAATGSPKKR
jgi:hypothetical protein